MYCSLIPMLYNNTKLNFISEHRSINFNTQEYTFCASIHTMDKQVQHYIYTEIM